MIRRLTFNKDFRDRIKQNKFGNRLNKTGELKEIEKRIGTVRDSAYEKMTADIAYYDTVEKLKTFTNEELIVLIIDYFLEPYGDYDEEIFFGLKLVKEDRRIIENEILDGIVNIY